MAQVKLDTRNKSVAQQIQRGREVLAALGTPPAAIYTALAGALLAATDELEQNNIAAQVAEAEASNAIGRRETSAQTFHSAYAALGGQVQVTTNGVAAAIREAGYDVRSEGSSVSNLDVVDHFAVTTTNTAGVLDFGWDRSKGEVNYELRGRKTSDPAGQYSFSRSTTKKRLRSAGFESGVPYEFQVRAHGTREMVSPWCDPFTKIAS